MEKIQPYVKAFTAYLKSLNKSFHTTKQYTLDAKQFAEIIEHENRINEALQLYAKTIQEKYPSFNSVNRKFASIRHFLTFLQLRGVISVYNEEIIAPLTKEETELNVLKEKQFNRALAYWPKQYEIALNEEHEWLALRNTVIVFTVAELGIKPAELVRMEWKHINSEKHEVIVLASKSYRILQCSKKLLELLEDYKRHTIEFMPLTEQSPYVWLGVGNKMGEPVTVKTIERIFKAMSEQLQFKVTATNMRYHAIQKLLTKQEDPKVLYEQFGYARKGVLLEREQRFPKNG
ncbi:tyrosine-type recombinase/integrase [Solibacillus sp. FSL R5-0691]|uniref:tyrosine-type recombinase/integrase n=1 Tax=Solibacillus sp. FSL R5-0691 TaxID=2921653 RepID=UPI0030D137AC